MNWAGLSVLLVALVLIPKLPFLAGALLVAALVMLYLGS